MPKWNKDSTSFPVKVAYATKGNKRFGRVVIPKPVLRLMGFPEEVCFKIQRNGVIVLKVDSN